MGLNKGNSVPVITNKGERLGFGKYRGWTIAEVLAEQPDYLVWAQDNIDGFDIHSSILDEVEDRYVSRSDWERMTEYFWRDK